MDEAKTHGYTVPCAICSDVNWGVRDDRYYCKSCHNVIDKTIEVEDLSFFDQSQRATTLVTGRSRRRIEYGRKWMICEGFQFILKHQAEALLRLGVPAPFKDKVLCQLWRLYLQTSRQAYTDNRVRSKLSVRLPSDAFTKDSGPDTEGPSASETEGPPASETEGPSATETEGPSATETEGASSSDMDTADPKGEASGSSSGSKRRRATLLVSGSEDSAAYLTPRQRRSNSLMNMTKTLALIHLALLWSREALTLADLLQLVREGHLPFVNAFECLPEEMKLFGRDMPIFKVDSIPSYETMHKETRRLAVYMDLPPFPPIGPQCLLHPSLLTLRYLTLANLPDELHAWVCRITALVGLSEESALTFDPKARSRLPPYDVQAASLIIVTLKLLFGMDDRTEWDLSNDAGDRNKEDPGQESFNLRRWYKLLQQALRRAQQREEEGVARKWWKAKAPIYSSWDKKAIIIKKRRIVDQLQTSFGRLTGSPQEPEQPAPSSFVFRWGDGEGFDGPSLYHQSLGAVLRQKSGSRVPSNPAYWHPALKMCKKGHCGSHFEEERPTLPSTYCWLLELFSFVLGVKPASVHEQVLQLERLLIRSQPRAKPRAPKSGETGKSRSKPGSHVDKGGGKTQRTRVKDREALIC